ncbi:MAG: CHAT domain-containing protein, partial [Anaerolineae bacterium]
MHNFDLRILGDADSGYRVEVTASPAGETPQAIPMPSPLDRPVVETAVHDLRDFRADPSTVRDLGSALWQVLFQPPIAGRYAQSLGIAGDAGLRIRLRIDPAALQSLPWEYLHNPETAQFLALARRTPLVRYVARPQPIPPLEVDLPLRLLVLISAPTDQPALQVDRERTLIEDALGPMIETGAVELTVETDGRPDRLQDRLRQGFHVLHYIGHGIMMREQGHLVLEDDTGESWFVGASALEPLLGDTDLRCVVLTACESATAPGDPFLGLAPALVRGGIPAVVAMQMSMPDESAVIFTREFYRSLAHRWPVDACVTEGRLGIRAAVRDTRIDWGIPALFMRSDDGIIFAPDDAEEADQSDLAFDTRELEAKSRSGGIDITGSTVIIEGDVAGRDMIKTNVGHTGETDESTDVVSTLRRAIRRLFG